MRPCYFSVCINAFVCMNFCLKYAVSVPTARELTAILSFNSWIGRGSEIKKGQWGQKGTGCTFSFLLSVHI